MTIVTYRVRLQEPVILTSLSGEPNSSVTYDYIPGSVMRGLIIGLHAAGNDFDAADDMMQRLFFNAQTRYLNAYIVNETEGVNQRSLPSPLSWQKPKYGGLIIQDNVFMPKLDEKDEADSSNGSHSQDEKPAQKMKSVKDFSVIGGDPSDDERMVYLTSLDHTLNVHNQRARRGDRKGRRDDEEREVSTVYRYDALAKGQVFEGLILCNHDEDAEWLKTILTLGRVVMLGGARSAGYGQAIIEDVHVGKDYDEYASSREAAPFILTCLSDVIVRDAQGEYQATLDSLLKAISPDLTANDVESTKTILDTVLVGGFNRKWGLPLPQTPALKMGSVIVFKPNAPLDNARLARLQREGVGERTIDGFGRLAVNWLRLPKYDVYKPPKKEEAEPAPLEEAPLKEQAAQTLWTRVLTHRKDQTAAQQLTQVYHNRNQQIADEQRPPRTQLARLRHVIANELRKEHPKRTCLTDFLKSIAGKHADKKYDDAKLGTQSLKAWLAEHAVPSTESDVDLLKRIDAVLEQAQKASKAKEKPRG